MKKMNLLLMALVTVATLGYSQTVRIGHQVWSTKNLDVTTFRNGNPIPEAKTSEEWQKAGENKQPAWCFYDNDPANADKYGKLYNWYAVNDSRGLAPKGWHIPSDAEWTRLTEWITPTDWTTNGEDDAGTKMKSITGWKDNGNGTNESGFLGLPGGSRNLIGTFLQIGEYGYWWSSTENNYALNAWIRYLKYNSGSAERFDITKKEGFSVRCLMD